VGSDLVAALDEKGADIERIAALAIEQPSHIPALLAGLRHPKARIKYGCEKVLRRISEEAPSLLYPNFEDFAALLEAENSFIKWGAILTLANLVQVDTEKRFDTLFERYFAPIGGPEMITAGNIVGAAARIARARPELTGRIVGEILKVETARYEHHGEVSEECRRVVCGHAVDTFLNLADQIEGLEAVTQFVRRQLDNPRPQVRKKTERFLRRLGDRSMPRKDGKRDRHPRYEERSDAGPGCGPRSGRPNAADPTGP
jgi:hypothetical protein